MIPSPEQHKAALDAAHDIYLDIQVDPYDLTQRGALEAIISAYLSALPEQQTVDTAELIARGMWQVAMEFGKITGSFTEQMAIRATGDDWHQYLPDAEKLIDEHSAPPAGESP